MKEIEIEVGWDYFDKNNPEDIKDREALQWAVGAYIERFNTIPPKGLWIYGGTCDAGKVSSVNFHPGRIYVHLRFD